MDKHRLELFSDGVFAIVLTLMVLDLKVPVHNDLSGLREIAPSILVHSLAFFLVGRALIAHHNFFRLVHKVTQGTMWVNLTGLFFVTFIPFGAKLAAENPATPLGAMILCLSWAGYIACMFWAISYWLPDEASDVKLMRDRQRAARISGILQLVSFIVLSGLCYASPWFGYIGLFFGTIYHIVIVRLKMSSDQLSALEASIAQSSSE